MRSDGDYHSIRMNGHKGTSAMQVSNGDHIVTAMGEPRIVENGRGFGFTSQTEEARPSEAPYYASTRSMMPGAPFPAPQRHVASRDDTNVDPRPVQNEIWLKDDLREGMKVLYLSTSHGDQFMPAWVKHVYTDDRDEFIIKVDLDIKKKANVSKIRRCSEEGDAQGDALARREKQDDKLVLGGSPIRYAASDAKLMSVVGRDCDGEFSTPSPTRAVPTDDASLVERFKKGDHVSYWSESHKQRMAAVVMEVRQDGLYNLNVKKGAKPVNIRPANSADNDARVNSPPGVTGQEDAAAGARSGACSAGTSPGPVSPQTPTPGAQTALPNLRQAAMRPTSSQMQSTSASSRARPTLQASDSAAAPSDAPASSPAPWQPPAVLFLGTGLESRWRTGHPTAVAAQPRSLPAEQPRNLTPASLITGSGGASGSRRSPLDGGDLNIGSGSFDPTQLMVRSQLLAELGFTSANMEAMVGFSGGLNEGIWFMTGKRSSGSQEDLVLKLVKCHRIAANVLTEAENFEKVYKDHSGIGADPVIAFPIKIFSCMSDLGTKRNDLIVMRRVPGERLAEVICRKYWAKQEPLLCQVFGKLGRLLAEFHSRYGHAQHGDFQPSNVFYDEASDSLAFIDVGGMGVPTMDNDVTHFRQAMNLLANAYGPTLHIDLIRAFDRGYDGR